MASMLLIDGGAEHAHRVLTEERRGYWSPALPLVLEKHGYLHLERARPEVLRHPAQWRRHAALLVASLPAHLWTGELVDAMIASPVPVLAEGPLPPPVLAALGVRSTGSLGTDGEILVASDELALWCERHETTAFRPVWASTTKTLKRAPELDWTALETGIGAGVAEAWRAIAWEVDGWEPDRSGHPPDVLVSWVADEGTAATASERNSLRSEQASPAIVRNGGLIGCSFGLFAFLGQRHTSEPFAPDEYRTAMRAFGAETLLLGLLDLMHASRGVVRPRVLPWPAGVRWVRNVRHDYDRSLTPEATRELLERHERAGTAATWYWRSRLAGDEALRMVAGAPRHEIALHTEQLWTAHAVEEERRVAEASRQPIRGASAHGSASCFRFQGAPNVLWAERRGWDYTELPQHTHFHPHRFVTLREDGTLGVLQTVCLPHHESFDISMREGETRRERIEAFAEIFARFGGFLQVMNHPDINGEALFALLEDMDGHGREDWTARETVSWWRRSHVADALWVGGRGARGVRLTSRTGVRRLAVELLRPDGEAIEVTVDLEPGETVLLDGGSVRSGGWKGRSGLARPTSTGR